MTVRGPRRAARVLAPCGVVLVLLGCSRGSDPPPEPALELTCAAPQRLDLGAPTVRRPATFTTTSGRIRFVVSSLPPPDLLSDNNDTDVRLADPDSPDEVAAAITITPRQPGVVAVGSGTYLVTNSHRGAIEMDVCPDVTVTDVQPAHPALPDATATTPAS